MLLHAYLSHLRARNLSPKTIKATEEYLRLFLHEHDPLTVSKRDIETYLGAWLLAVSLDIPFSLCMSTPDIAELRFVVYQETVNVRARLTVRRVLLVFRGTLPPAIPAL